MGTSASHKKPQIGEQLSQLLLAWYDRHARALPWRSPPGAGLADPYHVWLSEVMLQQTTVVTVAPYFLEFLKRWPRVEDLAGAPREEVMAAWAGLGYYARARNLHRCAQEVAANHGGRFPDQESELRKLPGIGDYTAAAVAAIAFDRQATVMDGNVERVVARLFAIEEPLPPVKPRLKSLAALMTPAKRPGDHAQAMMDLGATVCLPRSPKCLICPLALHCQAQAEGKAEELPRKLPKKHRPTKYAIAFFIQGPDGSIFVRQRPDHGMLGGMLEVPSTDWQAESWQGRDQAASVQAPADLDWRALDGLVRHGFTHFEFEITVWAARAGKQDAVELAKAGQWLRLDELADAALPTVMRKVVHHGLKTIA